MNRYVRTLGVVAALALVSVSLSVPALAGTRPAVTGLSTHHGTYWGGSRLTIHGQNFTSVHKVMFGNKTGYGLQVLSSTKLTVFDPEHKYGMVHVRVMTSAGTSSRTASSRFTFTRPTMNTPIQGGLTARQEQRISAHVRATHKGVHTSRRSSRWTAAMGVTAMKRARSWLGLPYSWAGGNSHGPTAGVCAHNGGDLDCHVIGFDCSGLALYAWAPYKTLVHYAATQHSRAGKFHPTIGELMPGDLVFFSGYIANGIGHVAVYEGHGMVIQAEESGTQVMRSRLVDVIAASGRYRGATRPLSTGRQGAGPHFSSVTPQISVKGGYITITGSQLSATTSVSVGSTMLYSFTRRTATRLVVKAPAHTAGTVAVTVSNAWGNARRSLTYVAAPHQSALSPAQGPTAGGTAVTITGSSLSTISRVSVGGATVPFKVSSATRLTLTMPAHAAGAVTVVVSSRFGTSNQKLYTFVAPPPSPAHTASRHTPSTSTPSTKPSGSTSPPSTKPSGSTSPPSTGTPSGSTTIAPTTPAAPTSTPTSTGAGPTTPATTPAVTPATTSAPPG